jgi:hypothetical protein
VHVKAGGQRVLTLVVSRVGRDGGRWKRGQARRRHRADVANQLVPILAWHRDVAEQKVDIGASECLDGVDRRGRGYHRGPA